MSQVVRKLAYHESLRAKLGPSSLDGNFKDQEKRIYKSGTLKSGTFKESLK